MASDLEQVVIELIAIELRTEPSRVRTSYSLKSLGMDSIAAANILFAIEERFEVELQLDGVDEFDEVGRIIRIVEEAIAKGR